MILIKHSLLPTMGNQCTGSCGSVPVQHSTDTLGEIQEITVLSTLLPYTLRLKFTMKQKQKGVQKPYLLHCFSSSCFIFQWALEAENNQWQTGM